MFALRVQPSANFLVEMAAPYSVALYGSRRAQRSAPSLVEAAVLGLVASLAGLGPGVLAAGGLQRLLGSAGINLPTTGLDLPVGYVAIAVGTGILITLVAALAPARKATVIAPVAALRTTTPAVRAFSTRRLVSGAACRQPGPPRRSPACSATPAPAACWSAAARSPPSSA